MRFIQVEITNRCNLGCPYCSRQVNPPPLRNMTVAEFDRVLSQLQPYKETPLCLCGLGEPLLNPWFPEMLDNPKLKDFKLKLITNGILLTSENITTLQEKDVFSQIQVSLQTTTPETYRKLQVGGDFHQVVKNTKNLIANKPPKTTIIIQHLKTRINQNESKKDFSTLLDVTFNKNDVVFKEHIVGPVGGMAQPYSYSHLVFNRPHKRACDGVFGKDLIINVYGDLLGCCWDNRRLQSYGNIFSEDLVDINRGEKLRKMRDCLRDAEFTTLPLCEQCYEVMNSYQCYSSHKP